MNDARDEMDADEIVPPQAFATGCLPQPPQTRSLAAYSGPLVAPNKRFSTDAMRRYVPRGKCQSSLPACCSYTTVKAIQTKYRMATGKLFPELSYAAAHQEITGGRMSRGARPLDSIELVSKRGVPPVVPGLPEWFKTVTAIPPAATALRLAYRGDEWEEIVRAEQTLDAIYNNDPVNVCIWWYDSDANPGPTGHLPVRGSGEAGGHSVLGCGIVIGYRLSPSGVGILINNHHGDSQTPAMKDERGRTLRFSAWGDDGFGVVPIERIAAGLPDFGSYALRTVTLRDADLDVPAPQFLDEAAAPDLVPDTASLVSA